MPQGQNRLNSVNIGVTRKYSRTLEGNETHKTHPFFVSRGSPRVPTAPGNLGAETPGQNVTLEAV